VWRKLIYYQKFVILLRKKHSYLLSQSGSADQTPVWFNMPESTAIEYGGGGSSSSSSSSRSLFNNTFGKTSVQVMTGAGEHHCTMMLAVTTDSHKLPPFVIFRSSSIGSRRSGSSSLFNRPFGKGSVQVMTGVNKHKCTMVFAVTTYSH
jgi:hypothetical protein